MKIDGLAPMLRPSKEKGNKKKDPAASQLAAGLFGAADGIRTHDINFGKVACCHYITAALTARSIFYPQSRAAILLASTSTVKGSCNHLVAI